MNHMNQKMYSFSLFNLHIRFQLLNLFSMMIDFQKTGVDLSVVENYSGGTPRGDDGVVYGGFHRVIMTPTTREIAHIDFRPRQGPFHRTQH